ncbi:FAD binding domain-containing protein [Propionibacteriaceae bacterium Y1923]|uniref:FAD binding domain-containing protein n=1 Tax=Aestuariimicrobium sp. Y1814 TaxID=3418742 RepID=UPI003C1E6CAC
MKPAPFTLHSPTTIDEAVALLAELDDAKVLAGGQSLVPVLNMRLATPAHLVDINRISELSSVEVLADRVRVGATVRHSELEHHDAAHQALPLLRQALAWVAHPAIRNRGTTVGSIAHADPSGEMPAVLAITDGTVRARSTRGERTISAEEFFVGPMESVLEPDELVLGVDFGRFPAGTITGYHELARRSGDYALSGVAVALTTEAGRVTAAKASFVSVTDRPDVLDLGGVLAGCTPDEVGAEELAAVAQAARDHVEPVDDIHASADYRRHLSGTLCRRVVSGLLAELQSPPARGTQLQPEPQPTAEVQR